MIALDMDNNREFIFGKNGLWADGAGVIQINQASMIMFL